MLLSDVQELAHPYVSWGRWVADCPRRPIGCRNAEHMGAERPGGYVGGLTETSFTCGHCHLQCPVQWPAEREVIDALLGARPVPMTRNWVQGEPVQQLLAENIEHGLEPVGGWMIPGSGALDT